jgi:hypothetical protein
MDHLGNNNHPANNPAEKPIPIDDLDKPIPLGEPPAGNAPSVSRAPLNLGGGGQPPPRQAPSPAQRPATAAATKAAAGPKQAGERITGIKTFFTKLHPGALDFMDEQIGGWLKEHPEVCIKHTNVTTGEVQAKKTEPNIIITVWY